MTICDKCGETYGRHRSAICMADDRLHSWGNVIDYPSENARLRSALEVADKALEQIVDPYSTGSHIIAQSAREQVREILGKKVK